MEEKMIEKKQEKKIARKKAYISPMLIVYGKLTDLTAGSNGTNVEANPVDPRDPNTRKP